MAKLKVAVLMAVILALFSSSAATVWPADVRAQQPPASLLQRITIGVARRPCDPAQVKSFALGKQPLEAVLAQVEVRSNSEKPIAAIKLAWRVYAATETVKAQFESCDVEPSATVLASGSTNLISLAQLAPKATITIGMNPLPVNASEHPTVFVEQPLITLENMRSLYVDGKLVPPGEYGLVIFVSEAQYLDGTTWTSPLR